MPNTGWKYAATVDAAANWSVTPTPALWQTADDNAASYVYPNTATAKISDFNFGLVSSQGIEGIEVTVRVKCSAASQWGFDVQLTPDNESTWSSVRSGVSSNSVYEYVTVGGPTDLWGLTWDYSGFSNANFELSLQTSTPGDQTVDFDLVGVRVYYTVTARVTRDALEVLQTSGEPGLPTRRSTRLVLPVLQTSGEPGLPTRRSTRLVLQVLTNNDQRTKDTRHIIEVVHSESYVSPYRDTRQTVEVLRSTDGSSEARPIRDTRQTVEVLRDYAGPSEARPIRDTRHVVEVLRSTAAFTCELSKICDLPIANVSSISDNNKDNLSHIADKRINWEY